MQTYRIVVGVDGSDGGMRALDWAVAEAARRGGTVHAVTTWQGTDPDLGMDYRLERERMARQALEDAVAKARAPYPQVAISTEAVIGPAGEVLTRAAADASLLVLGSHGHGRLFRAVVGSVTEACIRRAVCPVVVIPVPRVAEKATAGTEPISTAVH